MYIHRLDFSFAKDLFHHHQTLQYGQHHLLPELCCVDYPQISIVLLTSRQDVCSLHPACFLQQANSLNQVYSLQEAHYLLHLPTSTHQPFVNISSHFTRPNLFRKPATFYKLSTVTLQPAFNRPALYAGSRTFGTISKRCSHPVPVQYYNEKNVEDTMERGERPSTFPNPAVSSHQLLFNATTKPPHSEKHCSLSDSSPLPNVYRPVPNRPYLQIPYAAPPTYATLAKRFSSHPNPVRYYEAKKVDNAIERGQYVDIHDVGGLNPKDYDVLLTDVNYDILQGELLTLVGIPYL